MSKRWHYTANGQTRGPVSTEEIKELVIAGAILPHDHMWPAGVDPRMAVEASAIIDIVALLNPVGNAAPAEAILEALPVEPELPGWLSDVQQAETPAPRPKPAAKPAVPGWLEDVRRAEGK